MNEYYLGKTEMQDRQYPQAVGSTETNINYFK